jgi:hypothetical protein
MGNIKHDPWQYQKQLGEMKGFTALDTNYGRRWVRFRHKTVTAKVWLPWSSRKSTLSDIPRIPAIPDDTSFICEIKYKTTGSGYKKGPTFVETSWVDILAKIKEQGDSNPFDGGSHDVELRPFAESAVHPKTHWEKDKPPWVGTNMVAKARVVAIVRVHHSGVIEMLDVHDPSDFDGSTYFLLDCGGIAGAVFHLISDGDGYAVANKPNARSTDYKLSKNFKPKRTVDLRYLNIIDQFIIQKAIEHFFE